MLYDGNCPPGRSDRGGHQGCILLRNGRYRSPLLHIFTGICDQLTLAQYPPCRESFLATVEDLNQLDPKDLVQHPAQTWTIESWSRLEMVMGYARSYLRDCARHQSEITPATARGSCSCLSAQRTYPTRTIVNLWKARRPRRCGLAGACRWRYRWMRRTMCLRWNHKPLAGNSTKRDHC